MTLIEETIEGFKETEVGILPDDWTVRKLGEICEKPQYGYTASANASAVGHKFLRITDIQEGKVNWITVPYCECSSEDFKKYRLLDGDLVIARIGATTGKSFLISECPDAVFASYLIRVRTKKAIIARYLNHYTSTVLYWKQINEAKGGRLKQGVNIPILTNLIIPLPPLPEQQKIASVLSTVQEAKEKTENVIYALKELKKSTMEHLFTYGAVSIEEAEKVPLKETEIGMIPEHWKVVKIKNVSELITKGSSPNWQGFYYCESGIVFVRSQNIGWGKLELNDIAFLPEEFNKKEKRSIIKENDLLINIVGASIGRAAIANKVIEGGNLNQAIAIVRLTNNCNPHFIMYFLFTENGQTVLHREKKEIARANLSLQDIGNIPISLPPTDEQQKITQVISAIDDKINAEQTKRNSLDTLFKTLLSFLMTGRIRVKDLEIPI